MTVDLETVKKLVKDYGISSDNKNGQNFLINKDFLDIELDAAELKQEDVVLEIGAGFGALTEELLKKCTVIAIEKDVGIYSYLINKYELRSNLTLVNGDALEMAFPAFNKIVCNPPYNIVDRILNKLIRYDFDLGVMMLPKSISDQLTGNSEQTRISFIQRAFFDFQGITDVPKSAFYPEPRVTSIMVKFRRKRNDMMQEIIKHDEMTLKNAIMRSDYVLNSKTKRESKIKIESVRETVGDLLDKEVKRFNLGELEMVQKLFA